MSWIDDDWLSLDTESTGVDTDTDRVVTASLLIVTAGGKSTSLGEWLVDPQVEIPAEASAIHGVTTERSRAEGAHPAIVMAHLRDLLDSHWGPDVPLTVVNAPFDLSLLDAECRRHLGHPLDVSGPVLDPMVCDRALDKYRKGKRTLTDLCAHYGVELTQAHSSSADALAGALVMRVMARKYEQMARCSLEEMQEHQVRWRKLWAENFESYLRMTKRKDGASAEEVAAVVVDRAWPMRTPVVTR